VSEFTELKKAILEVSRALIDLGNTKDDVFNASIQTVRPAIATNSIVVLTCCTIYSVAPAICPLHKLSVAGTT
jgi:hypothetical protein